MARLGRERPAAALCVLTLVSFSGSNMICVYIYIVYMYIYYKRRRSYSSLSTSSSPVRHSLYDMCVYISARPAADLVVLTLVSPSGILRECGACPVARPSLSPYIYIYSS